MILFIKLIPTGIENFKELIDKNAYYVDKTKLIANCINEKCILYTRPRRFGKTLNMSMLYYFFSNKEKENAYLFNNLNISHNQEAMKHQNKYPTLFITLKDMKRLNLKDQQKMFRTQIALCAKKYIELLDSPFLLDEEKKQFNLYINEKIDLDELSNSLLNLSNYLYKHYHQKVIILVDEYDVPLQTAYQNGYYEEMVDFIRIISSSALKTNDALEKGILTGCLRISKESIFTGLNNFTINSIFDYSGSHHFGFTPNEVDHLLNYYKLSNYKEEIKEWYDGYLFGDQEIYNPWSTLMYIKDKTNNIKYQPTSYWANTSSNKIVMDYIQRGSPKLREEFELLVNGQTITKTIKPELTYREMDDIDNIYSFLLLTGYLKVVKPIDYNEYELIIPNREVLEIYKQSFLTFFSHFTRERKNTLYTYLVEGKTKEANQLLNEILAKSISYYDNKESFYHDFLIGLFNDYSIQTNKESGNGRFDIQIQPDTIFGTLLQIECKHSVRLNDLIIDAKEGINQIIKNGYLEDPNLAIYENKIAYSISFYKKQCYILKVE